MSRDQIITSNDHTLTTAHELRGLRSAIVRAARLVEESLSARLEAVAGISLSEFDVLVDLGAADEGRLRMKDVGAHLLISKTGVTRLIDRLEERGLVERAPCPSDRRVIWARITPAGRSLLVQAVPLADKAVEELIAARLGADDVAHTRATLDRLTERA